MPALETAPAAQNILLTQTRLIRAPRAKVYEAWTNPEIMKQWFGSAAMQCASAQLDVRAGGSYSIGMSLRPSVSPDTYGGRTSSAAQGHYTKVAPGELLQFTWKPDWNPEEESLVTVSLKDAPGGTEVTVLHERFANEASREAHNNGWASGLDRLQQLFAN